MVLTYVMPFRVLLWSFEGHLIGELLRVLEDSDDFYPMVRNDAVAFALFCASVDSVALRRSLKQSFRR